jgi:hypothetical protein
MSLRNICVVRKDSDQMLRMNMTSVVTVILVFRERQAGAVVGIFATSYDNVDTLWYPNIPAQTMKSLPWAHPVRGFDREQAAGPGGDDGGLSCFARLFVVALPVEDEPMPDEKTSEALADDRRSQRDRRDEDAQLPPRKTERRQAVERRLPLVDESTASFSDWVRSMVLFLAMKRKRARARSAAKQSKHKKR